MWKIAVADTAEDHLTLLKDALKAYFQETHRVFSVTSYTDLTFLEKDMAQGEHFDLLILDLVMNGQRSVEAVRRIREKEDGTPLIFLTANREYAVESYEMNALDYMIKPLKKERLVKRLDQLFKRKNPRFSVRTQGDYSYYGYDELEFKCSQNLGRIEEQLREDPRFYRCHRGYIVNLDYVEQIREVMLLKGDLRVPYRLRNKRKIKEDYQRYVTENICFLKEGKGSGKRMG